MGLKDNLMALHRELRKTHKLPEDPRFVEVFALFDSVASEALSMDFRSCPICGSPLKNVQHGWECNNMYHGSPVIFIEGKRNCPHCEIDGPYCLYSDYCLRKRFVGYGKPSMCSTGRIDSQSPK